MKAPDPAGQPAPGFDTGVLDTRYPGPGDVPGRAYWFIFGQSGILVPCDGVPSFLPVHHKHGLSAIRELYIGSYREIPCFAVELVPGEDCPAGYAFADIRDLDGCVDRELLGVAGRASHLLGFCRTTRFCGACGAETVLMDTEIGKQCPSRGIVVYPRLSPAILVLVMRDDEVLLASSPRFPKGLFSLLAGFVEPGETVEHAVRREVMEETGISIRDIRYFGSQPWPFPDSLMLGFVASYDGGEITPDTTEIDEAHWFSRERMPRVLPRPLSLSRMIIDWFLEGCPGDRGPGNH